jgi:hypothetical protein
MSHIFTPEHTWDCTPTTLRIPLRRFLTHIFFSALAVLSLRLLQKVDLLSLIYITYYPLILLANLALHESHFITRPLDMFYCLFLSLVLSFLHQLTTLLGQYLLSTNGFTGTQHVAVHFSLLFWVLTEFEFYWTYIDFRDFEATRDAIKSAWKANIDTNFPVTRDPYGIGYIKAVIRDRIRYREVALWTAQYYLFMFICGLLNLRIKCVVDPKWTATWEEVGKAMVSGNGWYMSERV